MAGMIERGYAHGCRIGTIGNVFVIVINGPASIGQLKLIEELQADFIKEQPKLVNVTVIKAPRVEAPYAEFRATSARIAKRFEPNLICAAVLVATSGLAAVITRTFMVAYQLLTGQGRPYGTFRDLAKTVEWVHEKAPETRALTNLAAELEALIART